MPKIQKNAVVANETEGKEADGSQLTVEQEAAVAGNANPNANPSGEAEGQPVAAAEPIPEGESLKGEFDPKGKTVEELQEFLEDQIEIGMIPGAASALVVSWADQTLISREDKLKLLVFLSGVEDERTNSQAMPTTEEELKADEIISYYKPKFLTLKEAEQDATLAVAQFNSTSNELEGSALARLAFDLADIAYHSLRNSPPLLKVSPNMAKDLITLVKKRESLGKDENIVDSSLVSVPDTEELKGGPTQVVVEIASAYKGRDNSTLVKNVGIAATMGCLLALGHETRVTCGYIKKEACSGKRFNRSMVFEAEPQGDGSEYYKAICVPTNVVAPNVCYPKNEPGTQTYRLVEAEPNKDTRLRYLVQDWAYALYNHYLGDPKTMKKVDLAFEMEATNRFPTGMLLREGKVTRAPQTAGGDKEPTTLVEAKELIKKKNEELAKTREAVAAEPSSEKLLVYIETLDGMITDRNVKSFPTKTLAAVMKLANHTFSARISEYVGKTLPTDIGNEMVKLYRNIDMYVRYNDQSGTFIWVDDNDTPHGHIGAANPNNGNSTKAA